MSNTHLKYWTSHESGYSTRTSRTTRKTMATPRSISTLVVMWYFSVDYNEVLFLVYLVTLHVIKAVGLSTRTSRTTLSSGETASHQRRALVVRLVQLVKLHLITVLKAPKCSFCFRAT